MENSLNTDAGIAEIEQEFESVQISQDAPPTKIFNRIKFYAHGTGNNIKYSPMGANGMITFQSGQQIQININASNLPNATVIANGNMLRVIGLNDATVTGCKEGNLKDEGFDNKIFAENCKNCTIETGPVVSNCVKTIDKLVMKNCKQIKVFSGQTSTITGIMETTADVMIFPPEPKAVKAKEQSE